MICNRILVVLFWNYCWRTVYFCFGNIVVVTWYSDFVDFIPIPCVIYTEILTVLPINKSNSISMIFIDINIYVSKYKTIRNILKRFKINIIFCTFSNNSKRIIFSCRQYYFIFFWFTKINRESAFSKLNDCWNYIHIPSCNRNEIRS